MSKENFERYEGFSWEDCADVLEDLASRFNLVQGEKAKSFVSTEEVDGLPLVEFIPPTFMPLKSNSQTPSTYLADLSDEASEHLVLLIQAGAAALGWWSDGEFIHHKVLKAYVVRGRGRAQTLYAKTKGKSRYGSRLRLQNAQQHLVDINERVLDWWEESGPADLIFYSCPQRTWPELFNTRPELPFDQRDEQLIKIPMHVHVPNLEELKRVRRKLIRGSVLYRGDS